jgi:hypothetical protein
MTWGNIFWGAVATALGFYLGRTSRHPPSTSNGEVIHLFKFEGVEEMYKLQADAGPAKYSISLEGVKGRDRYGNTFDISAADVDIDVRSSDEGIVSVKKDSELEGSVSPGGVMGVGVVTVTVKDNRGVLLATESATFVVGHGSLAGISAIGLKFEGLTEEKATETEPTALDTESTESKSGGSDFDPLGDVTPTIAPEGNPNSAAPPPHGVGPTSSSPVGVAPTSSTSPAEALNATTAAAVANTSASEPVAEPANTTEQPVTDTGTPSLTGGGDAADSAFLADETSSGGTSDTPSGSDPSLTQDATAPQVKDTGPGDGISNTPTPGGEQSSSAGMPVAPDETTSPLSGGTDEGQPATTESDLAGTRTDADFETK